MSRHYTDEDLYSPSEEEDDLTLTNGSATSYLALDSEDDFILSSKYPVHRDIGRIPGDRRHRKSGQHGSRVKHHSGSFAQTSLSTIPHADDSARSQEVQEVYRELQEINLKLKKEFKILHDRDQVLKDKEKSLSEAQENFDQMVQNEVKRLVAQKEQELNAEINSLDLQIKEKCRENKRLKENFDTLKTANDNLRKELENAQQQHEKLEKQSSSLQARLANLQRKQEHSDRKEESLPAELVKTRKSAGKENKNGKPSQKPSASLFDLLSILLEWVAEVHLRRAAADIASSKPLTDHSLNFLQDKCFKVLPSLVDILRDLPGGSTKLTLPCLQFIHWALVYTEHPQGQQRSSFPSTLRRLGEELYKPRVVRFTEDETREAGFSPSESSYSSHTDRTKETTYFRSNDLETRFLSSLIILRTHLQVDHLAHVLEVVRTDLKSDRGKELFLQYQATPVFHSMFRPANKYFGPISRDYLLLGLDEKGFGPVDSLFPTLSSSGVDVYLQMSMESPSLTSFLASCSNEAFFRHVSMLFRMPSLDQKITEKLSIIFQKLSKIKSNKRYFEVFGVTTACQEMLRAAGNDNAFLTLNLKSMLFNVNPKSASVNS